MAGVQADIWVRKQAAMLTRDEYLAYCLAEQHGM